MDGPTLLILIGLIWLGIALAFRLQRYWTNRDSEHSSETNGTHPEDKGA